MKEIDQDTASELYDSLKSLLHLIDVGILVRNTENDVNYFRFLKQSIQLTTTLVSCQRTLLKIEGR